MPSSLKHRIQSTWPSDYGQIRCFEEDDHDRDELGQSRRGRAGGDGAFGCASDTAWHAGGVVGAAAAKKRSRF